MRAVALIAVTSCLCLARASAQEPPPPDQPAQEAPPPEEPASATPPPEPVPVPPPAQPAPAPQPYAEPAPQPYAQPAPAPAAPPPSEPRYEGEAGYAYGDDYAAGSGDEGEGEDDGDGFEMPPFSIRLDPFNWVLNGRLGFELEVGIWKFLSVELVPVFVVAQEPILLDWSSYPDGVSQHSNGLGPISGASLGLGFWLDGEPFRGYVLRAIFTNYGYEYEASDSLGTFDRVKHTERQFIGFIGSYARWGFFTMGGGIGLGYELNQQERCNPASTTLLGAPSTIAAVDRGCDALEIATRRNGTGDVDLRSFLYPAVMMGRFSLGVAFD